jgi:hypothetical protein
MLYRTMAGPQYGGANTNSSVLHIVADRMRSARPVPERFSELALTAISL